jgi:hypothetical protein
VPVLTYCSTMRFLGRRKPSVMLISGHRSEYLVGVEHYQGILSGRAIGAPLTVELVAEVNNPHDASTGRRSCSRTNTGSDCSYKRWFKNARTDSCDPGGSTFRVRRPWPRGSLCPRPNVLEDSTSPPVYPLQRHGPRGGRSRHEALRGRRVIGSPEKPRSAAMQAARHSAKDRTFKTVRPNQGTFSGARQDRGT